MSSAVVPRDHHHGVVGDRSSSWSSGHGRAPAPFRRWLVLGDHSAQGDLLLASGVGSPSPPVDSRWGTKARITPPCPPRPAVGLSLGGSPRTSLTGRGRHPEPPAPAAEHQHRRGACYCGGGADSPPLLFGVLMNPPTERFSDGDSCSKSERPPPPPPSSPPPPPPPHTDSGRVGRVNASGKPRMWISGFTGWSGGWEMCHVEHLHRHQDDRCTALGVDQRS